MQAIYDATYMKDVCTLVQARHYGWRVPAGRSVQVRITLIGISSTLHHYSNGGNMACKYSSLPQSNMIISCPGVSVPPQMMSAG